jgi:hypothetical protein
VVPEPARGDCGAAEVSERKRSWNAKAKAKRKKERKKKRPSSTQFTNHSTLFSFSPASPSYSTVVDPYLNLFRGLLPPLGQIDLSPILAFVVLDLFSNAAAALPCEMPQAEGGGGGGGGGVTAARAPAGPGRAARRGVFRRRNDSKA